MELGQRIKTRREELGLSVNEVANKIGKDRTTVYKYENGTIKDFSTTTLISLAKILQTTPMYLAGWD